MMRRTSLAAIVALVALMAPVPSVAPAAAAPACDPFTTPPSYLHVAPTSQQVLGFALGSQEVDVDQSNAYLDAVANASDRVIAGTAATSVQGRALRYAVVGRPDRMTPSALATIRSNATALRNPTITPSQAAALEASTPEILWLSANVHGDEESGADAALQVLYELADRSDCVVSTVLDRAIVVILPIQNPDGRELNTRRNANGFDMNRDWFARTQPETDGKVETVRQYPPMLYIDAHEFGLQNYFFPPNADPEYHEIPDTAHHWINDLYSPAIAAQFTKEKIHFFHGAPYDFFAIVFGDTVPTEGFEAAGMTFEKANFEDISVRFHEHFTSMWASISAAANDPDIVRQWHDSYVEAYQEGVNGTLEPNAVFEKGHTLLQPVPTAPVRHYFLLNDPSRAYELQLLVRRLQRMDVSVYSLNAPLAVPHFHPYAEPSRAQTLPAGTYWIPLAQGQKHWIQAMLNEDTYIPIDVTYDVTAWSNPLLENLSGGWTGDVLSPNASLVAAASTPSWPAPGTLPRVGLFQIPGSTAGFQAAGEARWLFDTVWHLPYTNVTAADITAGLPGIDVLVVPDGYANYGLQALGAKGKKALLAWVKAGGRYVGWQGGAEIAAQTGVSTVTLAASHTNMPGSLVRVTMDPGSPLTAGVGPTDWVMYLDDMVMRPGAGYAAAAFPAPGSPSFGVSGLAEGVDQLAGSAAVVDETVGSGRSVVFSIDPNFRGWTQGTQRILWNAITGPNATGARAATLPSAERASAVRSARAAADAVPQLGSTIRIAVGRADAAATAHALRGYGAQFVRRGLGSDGVLFLVANRRDLSVEEHPFFAPLVRDLTRSGVDLRFASIP
ncbi:MAG TPA: M14 family zinc carboxypeptidase [Actinomycetota bacterium]|nr:M14 family zinc carboxypeptidase [Actinomycetota bacterium]